MSRLQEQCEKWKNLSIKLRAENERLKEETSGIRSRLIKELEENIEWLKQALQGKL